MTEASIPFDRLTSRIIAGVIPLRITHHGKVRKFNLKRPTRLEMLELEDIYDDAFRQAEIDGQWTEEELECWLWEEGLWDESKEKSLRELPKDIEKLKIGLYENRHDLEIVGHARKGLQARKVRYNDLFHERHANDGLSCAGFAKTAKIQHKLAMSLYEGNAKVFPNSTYLDDLSDLLQDVLLAWSAAQLDENTLRAIARNAPWRPIWQARECSGSLFGIAACDYTEEQQQLVAASQLYEQIRQHPDCPAEFVLNDDDMLDGWLILEHRKHSKLGDEKDVESTIRNPNIKSSQEVFKVVGRNKEFAEKVNAMNSEGARKTIEKRFGAIEQNGKVSVQNLPDMKQRILVEKNNAGQK